MMQVMLFFEMSTLVEFKTGQVRRSAMHLPGWGGFFLSLMCSVRQ